MHIANLYNSMYNTIWELGVQIGQPFTRQYGIHTSMMVSEFLDLKVHQTAIVDSLQKHIDNENKSINTGDSDVSL